MGSIVPNEYLSKAEDVAEDVCILIFICWCFILIFYLLLSQISVLPNHHFNMLENLT